MTDDEITKAIFNQFALVYPVEAYQLDPEAFWKYFQTKRPGCSREDMLKVLEETSA